MEKTLTNLEKYIFYLTVFLAPLAFLPLFPDAFGTPKLILLALGVSILILIHALKTFFSGKLEYSSSNFDIPVLIIASSYLASSVFVTPNKMEAFFVPGVASFIVLGTLLYLLANTIFADKKGGLLETIFLSSIALSASILLATTGLLGKLPPNLPAGWQVPSFLKDVSFNPLGSSIASAIFLGVTIPLGVGLTLSGGDIVRKLFWAVGLTIVLLGFGLSVYPLLPGKTTSLTLPSYQTNWMVAVSSLGESPIFGVGPGNFLSAFNRYRPVSYNLTALWQTRFTTAASFLFTFMTENGLSGLFGLILLLLVVIRNLKKNLSENLWTEIALVLTAVSLLLLPASLIFLPLFLLLVSLNSQVKHASINLIRLSPASFLVSLPLILAVFIFLFFASRVVLAEARFQNALLALSQNDGTGGARELTSAISGNPYVDRYHALSGELNLAVARGVSQKKNLTEADKTTITQAIQGAIAEGKATVALNAGRSQNWAFLARIYQSIMPYASGADTFTIQTYNQAIALDPIDPNLRIALGGVYYALGRYDDAISTVQLATFAKPDLANAHYNLAIAYRDKGEIDKATNEMKTTLSLVQKGSEDYKVVQTALDDLEKRKPATKSTKAGGTLTAPQPQIPVINSPITLPSEATPPATPPGEGQ